MNRSALVQRIVVYGALVVAAAFIVGRPLLGHLRPRKTVPVVEHVGRGVLPDAEPAKGHPRLGYEHRRLRVGALDRGYLLLRPLEPRAEKLPLVLVLHGDGGSAESYHRGLAFERGSGESAVLAYPDGVGSTWDLETTTDNRDVAFLEALVEHLVAEAGVDRARVYATGYSSGGFMANVLACQRPGLLRAISSSAGGAPYGQKEKWPNGYPKCPGQQPIALLALHGSMDLGVTPDSGRFSAEYWAYVNGCDTGEMETTRYEECTAFRGCPKGRAVAYCEVPGLGHWVWDRSPEITWAFFSEQ